MSRLIATKKLLIQVICLLFVTNVAHCNQESLGGGKFILSWSYNASDERLYFKVVAETSGWVGLGFSDQNEGMKNLDCVVGGVSAGTGYLNDFKATSQSRPTKDAQQSYTLVSSSEVGSKTTIEFSRKRDTLDADDMQFTEGVPVYIAWAYHNSIDATNPLNIPYHSSRGYSSSKVVFVPVVPGTSSSVLLATAAVTDNTTEMASTTVPSQTAYPVVPGTSSSVVLATAVVTHNTTEMASTTVPQQTAHPPTGTTSSRGSTELVSAFAISLICFAEILFSMQGMFAII